MAPKSTPDLASQHADGKLSLSELNAKAAEAGVAACRPSNGGKRSDDELVDDTEPAPAT